MFTQDIKSLVVRFGLVFILVTGMLGLQSVKTVHAAATWYVATIGNDTNDCVTISTPCATINGAIGKAADGNTIEVAVGTYTGSDTEVVNISKSITLSGGWDASFTTQNGISVIDGQGIRRGITTTSTNVAINHFAIQNGFHDNSGGGIYHYYGSLTLNNTMVSNNSAPYGGGIYAAGDLTLNNSTVHDNSAEAGGGIYNFYSTLTLNNIAISNNRATLGQGGAIINNGTLALNNVTISKNSAPTRGGGIYNNGALTLNNVTISDNNATDFNAFGGGVYTELYKAVTFENSIIAGNNAAYGPDCFGLNGTTTSHGHNLISNTTGCPITATGGDNFNIDPGLGTFLPTQGYHPLLPNSLAVDAGDSVTCLTTDQRGLARLATCDIGAYEYAPPGSAVNLSIVGGNNQLSAPNTTFSEPLQVVALDLQGSPVDGVDITFASPARGVSLVFGSTLTNTTNVVTDTGGVAVSGDLIANNKSGSYVVTASVDALTPLEFNLENTFWYVASGGNDANSCKLPTEPCATIDAAINKAQPGNTVLVASGTYYGSGTGTSAQVVRIDKDVILEGGWDNGYVTQNGRSTIDGESARRGIAIYEDFEATVTNFTIINGSGGIDNAGVLTLKNSTVSNSSADEGGGIRSFGTLVLTDATLYGNSAHQGGGIYVYHGSVILNNVTINNNTASFEGGGIHINGGSLSLNNVTISNNASEYEGGGINQSYYGEVEVENSIISDNSSANTVASDCSGGLTSNGHNIFRTISGCTIVSMGGDQFNTDPLLGTFDVMGGFQPLLPASPAMDAGDDANCPATDQRGVARPQGSHCDIGAYEAGGIKVIIGNAELGAYALAPMESTRLSLPGTNNGPVQLINKNGNPLIAAERVIYKVNNVNTSFSEMMALPDGQLDDTYWLPWYNNVDLDTQLRFGNVSGTNATVHVFIGGTEMTSGCTSTPSQAYPYVLTNGQSIRVSCAGINSGLVQIVSDQPIVAAERVIYKVNGVNASFSELMALPVSQLDDTYWLPWYNNVDLDTQLRFGNVSEATATVHVFIGGVESSGCTSLPSQAYPYVLTHGSSIRVSCAGVNNGPVQIVSDENIVAAERVIYKVNGTNTSFSELMALPEGQLDDTYWLPWYNNVDLDTQLRFGNVSGSTATVRVYIGGVEISGCTSTPSQTYPYVLTNGSSIRVSCAGKNAGPVQIVSDEHIVAAERVIYKVNGINTSFSELMALPESQLDDTYWLPWYNNIDLDTQLRFGVP